MERQLDLTVEAIVVAGGPLFTTGSERFPEVTCCVVGEAEDVMADLVSVVTAMVGMLTALPGTRLHTRLTREGRLVGRSSGDNLDAEMNFEPTMERAALRAGYHDLVKVLDSPREYYERCLTFLAAYRPVKDRAVVHLSDVLAFARSLCVLGVMSRGRWEFWKYLGNAWMRYRRAFPEAVELAIRGYHFRRVAESM